MTDEQINELAGNLDIGLKCYVHKKTKAILTIPDELDEFNNDTDLWDDVIKELKKNSRSYVEIEKMGGRESFQVMEEFVQTVDDIQQREIFERALSRPKPFSNFKFDIDNSGPYRQQWFDFKNLKMVEWVKAQLSSKKL
jgi:hypothetical protein